ncbi:hypothetical protein [Streptomyces mangrovi]|uniref:hypothetical protein n=1 Tax=Streptomyces mangrovi TaxID=1206892 RepID=UPI00399C578E
MPRGRHRHAPPLHRMLAPFAVAAVALVSAAVPWLIGDAGDPEMVALRLPAAAAAAAAVTGAVLLRRWDREAGRRVGEVRAAKATAEWRAEERQAELETELEESLEIRRKAEDTLRSKRAELERLRTEHAALLRRYATAETERASALEGRRQLALEAAGPAKALTTGAADHRRASGAPTPLTYLQADEALRRLRLNAARQREREEREGHADGEKRGGAERGGAERGGAETVPAPEPGTSQQAQQAQQPRPPQPRTPRRGGTAGPGEPYGQGSGSRGSGAPKRGGFDFFGTQGARKRRRAPGPQGPAAGPSSDQEDDPARADAPGDAPEAPARTPSPAVAGKVIDLGEPGGDESADGDSAPADGESTGGTPRSAGPVRGLRRTRSA